MCRLVSYLNYKKPRTSWAVLASLRRWSRRHREKHAERLKEADAQAEAGELLEKNPLAWCAPLESSWQPRLAHSRSHAALGCNSWVLLAGLWVAFSVLPASPPDPWDTVGQRPSPDACSPRVAGWLPQRLPVNLLLTFGSQCDSCICDDARKRHGLTFNLEAEAPD